MTPLFEEGIFHGPAKIAIADNGDLIVADSGRHRVIQVSRDGTIVWELTNVNDPIGVWR